MSARARDGNNGLNFLNYKKIAGEMFKLVIERRNSEATASCGQGDRARQFWERICKMRRAFFRSKKIAVAERRGALDFEQIVSRERERQREESYEWPLKRV